MGSGSAASVVGSPLSAMQVLFLVALSVLHCLALRLDSHQAN
jgi:hypothetical protein